MEPGILVCLAGSMGALPVMGIVWLSAWMVRDGAIESGDTDLSCGFDVGVASDG
jgi:hypothetical protein